MAHDINDDTIKPPSTIAGGETYQHNDHDPNPNERKSSTEHPYPSINAQGVINCPASEIEPSKPSVFTRRLRFGWGRVSPDCLQHFNTPFSFLVCSCVATLFGGFVTTSVGLVSPTSIERQFGITSAEIGILSMAYNIALGIVSVMGGYLRNLHKPRCIAKGIFIMVLGAVIVSLPKFVMGNYKAGTVTPSDFCTPQTKDTEEICDSKIESTSLYFYIFLVGFTVLGVGSPSLWTLVPAHIDDVTTHGDSSMYMGVYHGVVYAIAPALAFFVGKPLLSKWVDLEQPEGSSLDPDDPTWVGAWWLSVLVGAGLLLLPVVPMLGFPKQFPDTAIVRKRKKQLKRTKSGEENKEKKDLKSALPALKKLLSNSSFVLICLAMSSEMLAVNGLSTFLQKFVHVQFHFTEGNAALAVGCIVVPGTVVGTLLGGYLLKKFNWKCKQILQFSTVLAFISALCMVIVLVGCPGRTVVDQQGRAIFNSSESCNEGCGCSLRFYKPICTKKEQRTFYSPCHAGCQNQSEDGTYVNCSCFSSNVTVGTDGRCTEDCTLFPLFAVGIVVTMLVMFMNNIPMLIASLRVSSEGEESLALGVGQVLLRLLGYVPGPIIFGALIDESCILWQRDPCEDNTSNCLEYNQQLFRYYLFAGSMVVKLMSFFFIFLAYKLYREPPSTSSPPSSVTVERRRSKLSVRRLSGF